MKDYNEKIAHYKIVEKFVYNFGKYDYLIDQIIIDMKNGKTVSLPKTETIVKILNEFEIFAIAYYYLEIDDFLTWSMVNSMIYKFMAIPKIKKIIEDSRKNQKNTWNHIIALRQDMSQYNGKRQAC